MSAPTTDPPSLSVIIASTNHDALLERCVRALEAQAPSVGAEVIVVRASDREAGASRSWSSAHMPSLRWIDAPARSTVPQLRGLGLAASRSERLALLEDDCVAAADWCQQALSTDATVAATGGAVEPGPYERSIDWAVYFCEYGRFMRPLPPQAAGPITGNNVVYARWAIEKLSPAVRAEFREAFVHAAWQREHVPTTVDDRLMVTNINRWSSVHVTSVPFHHGRAYAGERFGARSGVARAGIALMMIGLPFVKAGRIVAEAVSRRRKLGRVAQAFPWILVFVTCWSVGEIAGCLRGPGDSASRWR